MVGGGDVGGEAEVGAFEGHEGKEVGGEGVGCGFGAVVEGRQGGGVWGRHG